MRKLRQSLLCAAFFFVFAFAEAEGSAHGSIEGRVTSAQSGAAVEGATVTVEGEALASVVENARRTVLTDTNGRYRFSSLPEGEYRISATASGFEEPIRTSLQLAEGEPVKHDFALSVRTVSGAYRVETVELPKGMSPEISGIDFTPSGRIVVCNRVGEVWIGDLEKGEWKRFAYGLYEPFGVTAESEDTIYVLQRPEITALRDTDGDGKADRYETVSDAWGMTGNYHEFAYGLRRDSNGNFYGGLGMASAGEFGKTRGPLDLDPVVPWDRPERKTDHHRSVARYQGWVFRVTPQGEFTPWASGFRQPLGIGISLADDLFVTDVAGSWIPSSQLVHVRRGGFYGHPDGLKWHPEFAGREVSYEELAELRTPPAVTLTHGPLGTSPGEPVWDTTDGAFGPFAGQVFIGDVTPFVMRVFLKKVAGEFQGAAFPFLRERGLRPGNMRNVFGPDGHLYLGQTIRGWREAEQGLQRIVWTGTEPVEISTMELTDEGFRLRFTTPMDRSSLAAPENYAIRRFQYNYHMLDGSLRINEGEVPVREARAGKDGRSVELELAELRPGFVYELGASKLRSANDEPLDNAVAYYTCNRLLSGETFEGAPVAEETGQTSAAAPDLAAGREIYTLYCAACHQSDGTGSAVIQSAKFVGDGSPLHKSDAELATAIRNGITRGANEEPAMPPFGQALGPREIENVIAYLRAAFGEQ